MSRITLYKGSAPAAPGAGKLTLYAGSADSGRVKYIDENGIVRILTSVEWPRNQLINGGFNFAQRQVPGTLTTYSQAASRAYAADRWFLCNENASVQYQQVDTIAAPETGHQHRYYGRVKKITSAGKFMIGQIMSAENMAAMRGSRVRVECWMKRTVAAAMTVRLGLAQFTAAGTHDVVLGWVAGAPSGTFISAWGVAGTDPTLGTNVARLTPVALTADGGTIAGAGMNCVLSGTMVRYSVCFDVPTDAKNLIFMVWTDGLPAANDELNIGQAGLYAGPEIIDWTSLPQIQELHRCQRFYNKSFANSTAPAQNGGVVGCISGIAGKAGAVALAGKIWVQFPVVMRAAPTVTIYCPTEASAQIDRIDGTTPIAHTATAQLHLSDNGVFVTSTGTTNTAVGDTIALHYSADAEL